MENGIRDERILKSWGQIAQYLDKSVRAVQYWEEKRGLPVHRFQLPDAKRPEVFAYKDEVDRWLASQETPTLEPEAASEARADEICAAATPQRPTLWPKRRFSLAAGLILLAGLGLASLALWIGTTGDPSQVRLVGTQAVVSDAGGRALFRVDLAAWRPRLGVPPIGGAWFPDLDEDGSREVLMHLRSDPRDVLLCWTASGKEMWRFEHRQNINLPDGRRLSATSTIRFVSMVNDGERDYVLTAVAHQPTFPFWLLLLDPASGDVLDSYQHPGWLDQMEIVEFDGDPGQEILVAGVNNPGEGPGHPALAILDVPFRRGLRNPAGDGHYFGPRNEVELAYYLFPQLDFAAVRGEGAGILDVIRPDEQTCLLTVGALGKGLYYSFDLQGEVLGLDLQDGVRELHDEAFRNGLLDHALEAEEIEQWRRVVHFPTAVDGNGAKAAAAFSQGPAARFASGSIISELRKR